MTPQPEEATQQLSNLRPSPEEIDAMIADYDSSIGLVKAAQEVADDVKTRLIWTVETFGEMPATATASKRLAGRRNEAIVTAGKTTLVNEKAVEEFRTFLDSKGKLGVFNRFFAVQVKHTIVEGARDVVKTFAFPARIEDKLVQLFGLCIDVKTKSPSVKVNVIQPEKPARKPRAKKAVA